MREKGRRGKGDATGRTLKLRPVVVVPERDPAVGSTWEKHESGEAGVSSWREVEKGGKKEEGKDGSPVANVPYPLAFSNAIALTPYTATCSPALGASGRR